MRGPFASDTQSALYASGRDKNRHLLQRFKQASAADILVSGQTDDYVVLCRTSLVAFITSVKGWTSPRAADAVSAAVQAYSYQ
jgi:hypothetical protein